MGKVKSILFLLFGALLAIFLYENWVPAPVIKIFGKEIVTISTSLVILICFLLGFLVGGLVCLSWSRHRRAARLSQTDSAPQKTPETQKAQEQEEQEKTKGQQ